MTQEQLQEQIKLRIEDAIDGNVDIGGDFRMDGYEKSLKSATDSCAKVAQIHALQQQIELLDKFFENLSDITNPSMLYHSYRDNLLKQLQEEQL